jgi:aryl-alcohol dehydrogenase-like predicted oxidoreductase
VPIPGTTKAHRLEENLGATWVELSQAELQRIEVTAGQIQIVGERYPEALEKRTGL